MENTNPSVADVVTEQWRKILGVESVNEDDDFFSIGGDSKLALDFIDVVEQRLNIEFPVEVLFVDGTLGAVVGACEEREHASSGG